MPNSPLLILYYSELPVQQYGKKKWENKKGEFPHLFYGFILYLLRLNLCLNPC